MPLADSSERRGPGRSSKRGIEDSVPVVLVVDIDDDLGEVLGKSLVVGEDEARQAILEYGLRRPSDPDVNAMLAGLQIYERFKSEGKSPLIVFVGGHPIDFLEAQRRIKSRVQKAVSGINGVPEFYIVSDGEDEFVVSQILSDIGRIGGFERVIVEQDLGIEGRYFLVLKYIKKAMFEPRFSKYALGIPGIALSIFALLSLVGLAKIALKTAALIIGIAMVLRGFNLEDVVESAVSRFASRVKDFLLGMGERPYFKLTGLTILVMAFLVSVYTAYTTLKEPGASLALRLARVFQTSVPLLGAGSITYIFITKIFYKLTYEEKGVLKSILGDISASIIILFVSTAFYSLGSYIARVKPEIFSVPVFIDSGFLQLVIAGAGLVAILEMVRHMRKEEATDQNSEAAAKTTE